MAKKRTGLQSQIASIFSGVPVPKKGGAGSEAPSAPSQPAAPVRPQPKTPPAPDAALPKFQPPVEPMREIPPAKVAAPRIPERKIGQVPTVPRRKKERIVAPRAGVSSARQKTAVAMVVILSILLVVLLVRPFQRRPSPQAVSGTAGQARAGVSPKANVKIDWPVPQKYPENLRDPMLLSAPKELKIQTPDVLVVKGITYSEDRKFVVIGTETFREGDTVRGATIIKINPNSVEFERDGKRWIQEVQGGES
jgi:hypothetical protein